MPGSAVRPTRAQLRSALLNRVFRENLLDPLERLLRRGLRRHQKRRPEPDRQRQLAGMHDRAGGHRGLPTAVGAFIGEGFGLQQPSSAPAATWANKPFWPTTLEKVLRTRAFRGKAALKLEQ